MVDYVCTCIYMYVHQCVYTHVCVCVDLTVHCIESEELEVEILSTFTLKGAPEGSENKRGIIKFNNAIEFILPASSVVDGSYIVLGTSSPLFSTAITLTMY